MNIGVAQTGGTNIGVGQYETGITPPTTGYMTTNKGFWNLFIAFWGAATGYMQCGKYWSWLLSFLIF